MKCYAYDGHGLCQPSFVLGVAHFVATHFDRFGDWYLAQFVASRHAIARTNVAFLISYVLVVSPVKIPAPLIVIVTVPALMQSEYSNV